MVKFIALGLKSSPDAVSVVHYVNPLAISFVRISGSGLVIGLNGSSYYIDRTEEDFLSNFGGELIG